MWSPIPCMARSLFVLCFLRLLLSVTHTFTQLDTSMSPSVSLSHTSLLIETSYLNRILIYIKISQSLHFRGNKVSMYLILSIYCVCCCCCFMFYCFFFVRCERKHTRIRDYTMCKLILHWITTHKQTQANIVFIWVQNDSNSSNSIGRDTCWNLCSVEYFVGWFKKCIDLIWSWSRLYAIDATVFVFWAAM